MNLLSPGLHHRDLPNCTEDNPLIRGVELSFYQGTQISHRLDLSRFKLENKSEEKLLFCKIIKNGDS